MHNKTHTIVGGDHSAGTNKMFYSDGSGALAEIALGAVGTVLIGKGATTPPAFGMQSYTVSAITATTSVTALDLSAATSFDITLQVATTQLNFTNLPAAGSEYHVPIQIIQDATGGRAFTWALNGSATTPKYEGGTAPAYTNTASALDVLHVVVRNGELRVNLVAKGVS